MNLQKGTTMEPMGNKNYWTWESVGPRISRNTHGLSTPKPETLNRRNPNIRASIIRIGFWGPLYYIYNEEPPQNSIGDDYKAPKLQKPTIDYD